MLEILFVSDILLNTMAYSTQGKNTEYLYNTSLEIWEEQDTWRV